MLKNLYLILGVERDSSQGQIKKAYRRIAKQLHPDTSACGADPERFLEAREAYEILADGERRRRYDEQLAEQAPSARAGVASNAARHRPRPVWQMPSLLHEPDPLLEELFSFSTARPGHRPPRQQVCLEVVLSPRESREGGLFPVSIPVQEPCPQCRGAARMPRFFCPACGGAGKRLAEREFALGIPPRTGHGTAVTLDLEPIGLAGVRLHVQVRVDPLLAEQE
ncbi:MAG: DnaJ domain-containing protein [Desulfobacterales bacterium]|jgi:molecular chaperone DnaJ|nr:DnaJ domain-containing protein [Desulfobacterales bacterium]